MSDQMGEHDAGGRRVDRLQEHRKGRRAWVVLAAVLSVLLLAGVAFGVLAYLDRTESLPPSRLIVISEAKLEDATTVAGLVAVLDREGSVMNVRAVDSGESVSIPGTSYNRLADALPLGGGDLIAKILYPADDRVAWVVLDPEATARLIDAAGGVSIDIPEDTTVFTGEDLFRFEAGSTKLDGAQAVALSLGAELFSETDASRIRTQLSQALGDAVAAQPDLLTELAGTDLAESSATDRALGAFLRR